MPRSSFGTPAARAGGAALQGGGLLVGYQPEGRKISGHLSDATHVLAVICPRQPGLGSRAGTELVDAAAAGVDGSASRRRGTQIIGVVDTVTVGVVDRQDDLYPVRALEPQAAQGSLHTDCGRA